jgi:hypothetical protein
MFVDETTAGARSEAFSLDVTEQVLTLREVIRRRVFQEAADYNAGHDGAGVFRGLVRPTDTERALNGFRMKHTREVDAEEQFATAVAAFGRNGFIVLVGDRQIEELDEVIVVRDDAEVTFLKLIPLVGG